LKLRKLNAILSKFSNKTYAAPRKVRVLDSGVIVILAVVCGSFIGQRIGISGGSLVFGLLAGLSVKALMKLGLDAKIEWLTWLSQCMVAYVLVRGSDFASIKDMRIYLPAAISYSAILLIFTLGMAWLYSRVIGMDFMTSMFATSPGGLTGIAVVAVEMGANATVSVLFNICRILVILVVVPLIANYITHRL